MPVSEARDSWLLSQPCRLPLALCVGPAGRLAAAGLGEAQAEETCKEASGLLGGTGASVARFPTRCPLVDFLLLYF